MAQQNPTGGSLCGVFRQGDKSAVFTYAFLERYGRPAQTGRLAEIQHGRGHRRRIQRWGAMEPDKSRQSESTC